MMYTETKDEKELVVKILSESFKDNKSVNLVAGETQEKISALMDYSYEMAKSSGKVFFSENKNAVALILFPRDKRFSLKILCQDLKLAINVIGLRKVSEVLKRESLIKKHHPEKPFIHLWYIGVNPQDAGKNYGSNLLEKIVEFADSKGLDIYLETSTQRNFNFYSAQGFEK